MSTRYLAYLRLADLQRVQMFKMQGSSPGWLDPRMALDYSIFRCSGRVKSWSRAPFHAWKRRKLTFSGSFRGTDSGPRNKVPSLELKTNRRYFFPCPHKHPTSEAEVCILTSAELSRQIHQGHHRCWILYRALKQWMNDLRYFIWHPNISLRSVPYSGVLTIPYE